MKTKHKQHEKLGEFFSTAICGNDITSSVLYVAGTAIVAGGIYAPLILLAIGLVLFLYKGVYREVVGALPVNGGAYNALLNGTSKKVAATAGVLTILSYIATCVISGKTAVEYVYTLINIPVIPLTIVVLGAFALLVISGVKDSAKVAATIFGLHLITLVSFVIIAIIYILNNPSNFNTNIQLTQGITNGSGIFTVLFLGFASSLLGVSGFESSANFVEEQKKGVFPKTLRNMLIAVVIFNPLIAYLCLHISTIPVINSYSDYLLADEARIVGSIFGQSGGSIFQVIVVADAFLVLSGAVLTSFIGVSGLIHRMSLDEVLPIWFSKVNKKGSYPRIVLIFFALSVSILVLTNGELSSLAGVYAISFLSVMSMFAIGNIILKVTRPDLKRYYKFPLVFVVLAFCGTATGVIGNVVADYHNFIYFLVYFLPVFFFVRGYIARDYVAIFFTRITRDYNRLNHVLDKMFTRIVRGKYVLFIHKPDRLFNTLKYIDNNEAGRNVIIIHCKDSNDDINKESWKELQTLVPLIPRAGVFPHLKVELDQVEGSFGPDMINKVAKKYKIPKNRIFIGSIHHSHSFDYEDLGGVRIIV